MGLIHCSSLSQSATIGDIINTSQGLAIPGLLWTLRRCVQGECDPLSCTDAHVNEIVAENVGSASVRGYA